SLSSVLVYLFFFHGTSTTEIYTLSLHDALPISTRALVTASFGKISRGDDVPRRWGKVVDPDFSRPPPPRVRPFEVAARVPGSPRDRKSTRLNSSHLGISYAVFCLKKKKTNVKIQ